MEVQEVGRRSTRPVRGPLLGALILALCGCFNPAAYTPMVTSVAPATTGTTRASVGGNLFAPGVTVYWNGRPVPTTYKTSSSVDVVLSLDDTKVAGRAQVAAKNDGGMLSEPYTVTLLDDLLTLASLDPPQAAPGSGALTLAVSGTGFRPDAQVLWNGTALSTRFNNSTSLEAAVPASLLAMAGEGFVQVANSCLRCTTPVFPFRVGTSSTVRVQAPASDMVWDGTHALLFITGVQQTVRALDPATGALGASVTFSSAPTQLSISAQDEFLYVSSQNLFVAGTRLSLPGLSNATRVPPVGGVVAIVAAPDVDQTAAFTDGSVVGVVDGTSVRSQTASITVNGLTWGFESSTLFGVDSSRGRLFSFPVDSTGVLAPALINDGGFTGRNVHYDRAVRLLFDDDGHVFDEHGVAQAGFTLPAPLAFVCTGAMDGAGGRMFFACGESDIGLTVRSFDIASRQPLSNVLLEGANFQFFPPLVSGPVRLVRFGANGIALIASSPGVSSSIYLYSGGFVH